MRALRSWRKGRRTPLPFFLALLSLLAACGGDDAPSTVDAHVCPDLDGDGHGAQPCGDDCNDSNATAYRGAVELCNGVDDDCDGAIDEDDPGGGASCTLDTGGCVTTGARICYGGAVICDAAPARETCNGVDDDCDGAVDEGVCDAVEVSAGLVHTCARRASGAVVCWGNNGAGQLGDGAASHTACIVNDAVYGPFPLDCSLVPTPVVGFDDAVELSAGGGHSCARRSSGSVYCWGSNGRGQYGNGTTDGGLLTLTGSAVLGLDDAVEISVGDSHTCARRSTGEVVCWGQNDLGQLGDGSTTDRLVPTPVSGLTDAVELAAGDFHTCARLGTGEVVCWGQNERGGLGDGTTTNRLTPTAVSGLTDAVELSAGGYDYTCARRASGAVVCWGGAAYNAVPTPVAELTDAVEISVGFVLSCARRTSGAIVCWDGMANATAVPGLSDAVELSASSHHVCARRVSGMVSCWGANDSGELGDGTHTDRLTPTPVLGL
jgi:alpha-tubulin suppressor-like RCC1 family protein